MSPHDLRRHCGLGPDAEQLLEKAMTTLGRSARAYTRVFTVAHTIADLAAADTTARDGRGQSL